MLNNLQLELNLQQRPFKFKIKQLNYKFGIPLDKKDTSR